MDTRLKRRVRRIAMRAYFCVLIALAGVVTWNATAGAHHEAATQGTSGREPDELGDLLGQSSPPHNGAQALSCETRTKLQMLGPLREASGLTLSRRTPGVLWSMNDSADPVVVPISTKGDPLGRVKITGAKVVDWEAIATGPCPSGSCLYVGDIGTVHGEGKQLEVTIYRVPEPAPNDPATATADAFTLDYPDKGHDAEGMFVMPDQTIYILTKGHPTELFRVPGTAMPGTTAVLEHVGTLHIEQFLDDDDKRTTRVTDAEISPDGKWAGVRTNRELLLYPTLNLTAAKDKPVWHVDLRALDETQGEGVAITNDGDVYLAGEGGGHGLPGTFAHIKCQLPVN
jgi:hypothetical protein